MLAGLSAVDTDFRRHDGGMEVAHDRGVEVACRRFGVALKKPGHADESGYPLQANARRLPRLAGADRRLRRDGR